MPFPPQNPGDYIVLLREPRDPTVLIIFPNQDSYEVESVEVLAKYLTMLGLEDGDVGRICDYLWNFYALKLEISEGEFEPLTAEQARAHLPQAVEAVF